MEMHLIIFGIFIINLYLMISSHIDQFVICLYNLLLVMISNLKMLILYIVHVQSHQML